VLQQAHVGSCMFGCLLENGDSNTHLLRLVEVNLLAVMLVLVEVNLNTF
jgi:hypothetical protein